MQNLYTKKKFWHFLSLIFCFNPNARQAVREQRFSDHVSGMFCTVFRDIFSSDQLTSRLEKRAKQLKPGGH